MERIWVDCKKCGMKTGNPDGICEPCKQKTCSECGGVMSYNRDDEGRKVRMCGDCGYSELYDYSCGHEEVKS